ncbi:Undecaprenyl diphosphate synthase [hydrothermal vent metagenome]|uniref:Undecaprenyl diphosphate synthase n=1 Tax=hydrothermal vent metagenome TaxID=652676 RepID=A0A3B0UBN1_9ZZZZ
MSVKDRLNKDLIPSHIAIIMDGNGRWAARHGNARIFGHEHGVEAVRSVVEGASEVGVRHLTLYAFSTENWARPKEEVNALMGLLVHAIEQETGKLNKNNVRLGVIGDIEQLPRDVKDKLFKCINNLKTNTGLHLILALSYGSRWEVIEAVRKIAYDIRQGSVLPENITNEFFESYLSTKGIPDPELLIRTSGEYRISNFLLWQIAYTELCFVEKLWPDFRKEDLFEAILEFQARERRFGKTGEQILS